MTENLTIALLISAISGILVAVITPFYERWIQRKRLKKALRTELEVLKMVYEPLKVKAEPPEDGSDIRVNSLTQQYTAVYDGNTDKLGMFKPKTASSIIEAYTRIHALMDTLLVYADVWYGYCHGTEKRATVDLLHKISLRYQEEAISSMEFALRKL